MKWLAWGIPIVWALLGIVLAVLWWDDVVEIIMPRVTP